MQRKWTGLWKNGDFLRLWSGQTISMFGSMIGGTAMSFTAILFLQASPFQMGLLHTMELLPAVLIGLLAGAWVDRVRRRPVLIAADLGRALVLASIPLAAVIGVLRIEQVYLVALAVSVLTILFNVAYRSYLPALVSKAELLEANSKLTASASVSEFAGFSLGGWLVQALSGPIAILIDAVSFIFSAVSVGLIRAPEAEIQAEEQPNLRREILDGLQVVWQQPLLRASATAVGIIGLTSGVYGSLVVLYMVRGVGFSPGILSMFWAVGGVSSFIGAALAARFTRRLGVGPAMTIGLVLSGLSSLLIPLASGVSFLSGLLLVVAQLGDGFYLIYEINLVSLRQAVSDERLLGRVNATFEFAALGASLLGALLGGVLGEWLGVRPVLFAAAFGTILAGLLIAVSPLRGVETAAEAPATP